jgi:hypothetical protein
MAWGRAAMGTSSKQFLTAPWRELEDLKRRVAALEAKMKPRALFP